MKQTAKKLKRQHVTFLYWLVEMYGYTVSRIQYSEIAFASGHNVQTVCNYVKRLEETGCATIEPINHYRRTIVINVAQCNELLRDMGKELI